MVAKNKINFDTNKPNYRRKLWIAGIVFFIIFVIRCQTENYSVGERIGFMTKFSNKGVYWKSWEGELNLTQTGMNSSSLFNFSLDNDIDQKDLIATIDSAVNNGWKVKLKYHQTYFKNWLSNRGETGYFVNGIEVLDRHSLGSNQNGISTPTTGEQTQGRVIDTVYVVIDKAELIRKMKEKNEKK